MSADTNFLKFDSACAQLWANPRGLRFSCAFKQRSRCAGIAEVGKVLRASEKGFDAFVGRVVETQAVRVSHRKCTIMSNSSTL